MEEIVLIESPVIAAKISFGIYLVHGPLIWTVGDRIYAAVGRPRITAPDRIPEWIDILPLSGMYSCSDYLTAFLLRSD